MAAYDRPDFCARALPLLRRAVDVDREFERAWFWLGVCQAMEGDAKGAIPALEQAVRLAPASGEYSRYLVWAYLKTGQADKALAEQTRFLNRR